MSKKIRNTNYILSAEDIETIASESAKVAAEVAAKVTMSTYEQVKKEARKNELKERTEKVRDVLRNYRKFKLYAENAISDIIEAKLTLEDLVYELDEAKQNVKVESIIRSRERSLILIAHIEKMLNLYASEYQLLTGTNDLRRYKIVYDMYIDPTVDSTVKVNIVDISERYHVDRSTAFADITRACEDIAPLFFGVFGYK